MPPVGTSAGRLGRGGASAVASPSSAAAPPARLAAALLGIITGGTLFPLCLLAASAVSPRTASPAIRFGSPRFFRGTRFGLGFDGKWGAGTREQIEEPAKTPCKAFVVGGIGDVFRHINDWTLPASALTWGRSGGAGFFRLDRFVGHRRLVIEVARCFWIIFPIAVNAVMRGLQPWGWKQTNVRAMPLSNFLDAVALLVEQVGGDFYGKFCNHYSRVLLHRFFFDQAENGERQGLDGSDRAMAIAAGAGDLSEFPESRVAAAWTAPKARSGKCVRSGPVPDPAGAFPKFVLHFFLVRGADHVNEIITIRPPRSRSRSWRAISLAASRFVFKAVVSMSPLLVARAELISIETSASVWSIAMVPPDGRSSIRSCADSIWLSIW